MNRLIAKIRSLHRWLTDRQGYFGARLFGLRVPVFPLMHLPDGFTVQKVGDTGLSPRGELLHCRRGPASDQRGTHPPARKPNHDPTTSRCSTTTAPPRRPPFTIRSCRTKSWWPLLYRAGMLLGLPPENVETVYVTRYAEGEYYKAHEDFYSGFDGDRLYTVLIYLNDMDESQGGGTVFEQLNIGVRPRLGRAVIWTNRNPDGSPHPETRHEAMPVTNGGEKWVIQLWFRAYSLIDIPPGMVEAPQTRPGAALTGNESVPAGAWAVGEVSPDSPYGKAFS